MDALTTFLDAVQAALEQYVFNMFSEPRVAIGIAMVLLIAGVLFVLWLIFKKWIPFYWRLRRLETVVRASKDEFSFVKDFASIDEDIKRIKVVRHGWEEFKETLVFPPEKSPEPIQNTSRPSNYINISEAETSGLHIKFIQAVPNYFVGLGLLFTFLGLVAAIYFASKGISAEADIAETQRSLQKLLKAATFKFLTSIAGILSSLLVAIFYRLVASSLQKRFDGLCEALEQRLVFATSESIAIQQFKELKKQTVQLERFNTDLAFSIATELDKKLNTTLPNTFENALAPLASTLNSMADRFGEMNQNAMSSMLEDFSQNLQQSAGTEMRAVAEGLTQTQDSLTNLVSGLQAASSQINRTLGAAGQRLESAASTMEESIKSGLTESTSHLQNQMKEISGNFHNEFTRSSEKFSAAMTGLSENVGQILEPMQQHMGGVTGRLDNLSTGLQLQIDSIGQLNENLSTLVRNTSDASERLKNAGAPVQRASEAIGAAAERIAATSDSTSQTHDKLSTLAETIRESTVATTAHWSNYIKRFETVDRDLANTFREFRDGTTKQQSDMREFVSNVDKEFGRALKNLAAGVENLQENIEEFTEAVDKLARQ